MKTHRQLATGLIAGVFFAAGAHAAECHFDKTLPVGSSATLEASTGSGSLKIMAGDGSRVHISGRVTSSNSWFGGDSSSDVQKICDQPPIEQSGAFIRVGKTHDGNWFHGVSIDYTIEVPRGFEVQAEAGSGDVELRDLAGNVSGTTGSGNLHATHLSANAKLGTGSGDIKADNLAGSVRLSTGSGEIRASFAGPGDVRASTGSGGIHLEDVRGGLNAHSGSGDIEASGKPDAPWQIGTASGGVKLHMPQGTGFRLDASSASGDVHSSLPLASQNNNGRHSLQGQVNSGGPEVRVQTASGDIRID